MWCASFVFFALVFLAGYAFATSPWREHTRPTLGERSQTKGHPKISPRREIDYQTEGVFAQIVSGLQEAGIASPLPIVLMGDSTMHGLYDCLI
jgi:hypothetical protein